ncbi:MAG TPA: glycosyltransferase family 4 protein [Sphingopyxis sp.]|uniref:glycosyltransferase family 4 protein n=1 Tax=Sphingopyxis sp. TaxID=1908224 RepID=UPI002E363D94|nr:glycosyltransferase family 4 protein [Sphingopyxis sp.]HEX2812386.1 glycosyltransferase family 4 protein [Sphingopyxis sp.]
MPSTPESIPPVHKNIWYVHPYAGGPGIGRFSRAFYLAQNWRLQSIRTTILSPTFHHLMDAPQAPGEKRIDDVSYHFIGARAYPNNGLARLLNMADFSFGLLRDADRLVARYGVPDAIIGSSPHPYVFLATHRLAKRYNAVSIFEVRDLWPLSLVELADVSPYHPLVIGTGWVERYAYRHADHVVSLQSASRPYMCERGVDADRWHYIPNGVDAQEEAVIEPDEPAYRRLMQWHQEEKFVVLYAGALGPPNNIDILVRAAAELRSRGNDRIRILVVGRGELQQQIAKMVSDLGLEERVAIYPQVPKSHAIGLMQKADVGYISLRPKPMFMHGISPNKLYDYMLAKLPIVSAMRVGNDSVTEAGCGLTVEPGDPVAVAEAFARLADMDRAELREMGERGLAFVRTNHDYAALARIYAELF